MVIWLGDPSFCWPLRCGFGRSLGALERMCFEGVESVGISEDIVIDVIWVQDNWHSGENSFRFAEHLNTVALTEITPHRIGSGAQGTDLIDPIFGLVDCIIEKVESGRVASTILSVVKNCHIAA